MDKKQKIIQLNQPILNEAYRFSVAPMLDYTDRHFRMIMRQISRRALLYTEMIVAKAIYHSDNRAKLLHFDPEEHPISIQIGGDDPKLLSEVAKIAEDWGYDEINFNVGCPSQKVSSGNFGACLMSNPLHVARCVQSMAEATKLPITVKHRVGIDNFDSYEFLENFVDIVALGGAKRFSIHARKAWLNGLNPKQNRNIPSLKYERIFKLKESRPHLIIELNGGLELPEDCIKVLKKVDGVMVGRAVYSHPLLWKRIDELFFEEERKEKIYASTIINNLLPYAELHLKNNGKLWDIAKHFLKLVEKVPGARKWRNELSIKAQKSKGDIEILIAAAQQLKNAGL